MKTFCVLTGQVLPGIVWPKARNGGMLQMPSLSRYSAFSLVEVVLAIGLVSFCILAIVGLLPVGLKAVKNSREESAAANALNQFSEAIRNATNSVADTNSYVAVGFPTVAWTLGTAGTSDFTNSLSLYGVPTNADFRLKARVELVAPSANRANPGRALITIAWPNAATWSGGAWTKSDGSVSASIQFLPKQ